MVPPRRPGLDAREVDPRARQGRQRAKQVARLVAGLERDERLPWRLRRSAPGPRLARSRPRGVREMTANRVTLWDASWMSRAATSRPYRSAARSDAIGRHAAVALEPQARARRRRCRRRRISASRAAPGIGGTAITPANDWSHIRSPSSVTPGSTSNWWWIGCRTSPMTVSGSGRQEHRARRRRSRPASSRAAARPHRSHPMRPSRTPPENVGIGTARPLIGAEEADDGLFAVRTRLALVGDSGHPLERLHPDRQLGVGDVVDLHDTTDLHGKDPSLPAGLALLVPKHRRTDHRVVEVMMQPIAEPPSRLSSLAGSSGSAPLRAAIAATARMPSATAAPCFRR